MARTVNIEERTVRRDAFVEAATRRIQAQGYERMSIQDVLDDTGASRGAFYHYFDSKQALLEAVIDRMGDAAIASMGGALDDPGLSAPEKFDLVFASIANYKATRYELVMAILEVWLSDDNAIVREKFRRHVAERMAPLLATIIRQGAREGSMTVDDPDAAALVVVSLMLGANELAGSLFVAYQAGTASIEFDRCHVRGLPGGPRADPRRREPNPPHRRRRHPALVVRAVPEGAPMTALIETERLTKSYGSHRGIIELDLAVEEGEAFGFLGPNGAGKTTTIRTLLDHLRPTSGHARIFGIDTHENPMAIHARVGYLPGEFVLYDKLTGGQTIEYFANLRGGVDAAYQADLVERLDIDPSRKFREYSKGNKQKIGLVIALQHKPELLILDEPTSGLDPLVQQTFYEVIREAKADGRTIFLSSHILSEVEKTCDRVAIIRDGRLARVGRVEELRDLAHHQVEIVFVGDVPEPAFAALPGVSDVAVDGQTMHLRVSGSIAPVIRAAAEYELADFVSREPSLEETFLAEYGHQTAEVA